MAELLLRKEGIVITQIKCGLMQVKMKTKID